MNLKNWLIVLFIAAVLVGGTAMAAQNSNNAPSIPSIDTSGKPLQSQARGFNFIGVGVAVNQANVLEFEAVRIDVQHVAKVLANNLLDSNATGKGKLGFGENVYSLNEVKINGDLNSDSNISINANIYDKNNSLVGTLALQKVRDLPNWKAIGIVRGYWNGTIALQGKTYNVFIPTATSKRLDMPQKLETAKERIENLKNMEQEKIKKLGGMPILNKTFNGINNMMRGNSPKKNSQDD